MSDKPATLAAELAEEVHTFTTFTLPVHRDPHTGRRRDVGHWNPDGTVRWTWALCETGVWVPR